MPILRGLRKGVGAGAYVFKVPLSHSGARGSSPPPDRYNMGGQLRYKGDYMTAFGSKPADLAMPAVLFFDVDGTLVWHDPDAATGENIVGNAPSAEVYKAFHALADNGHRAFICTGRPLSLVAQDLLDLKPAGLITGAGATIVIDGKIVYQNGIARELLDRTLKVVFEAGAGVMYEGANLCVSLVPAGVPYEDFPGVATVRTIEDFYALAGDEVFDKISFMNSEVPALRSAWDFLGQHYTICDLGVGVGEMSVIGTDKGSGIRHALEALASLANADAAADAAYRTFAFGDSENDLPMMRVVDHPVAMGNALDSVKQAASYVTASVQEDGVPAALRHFGLI